MATDQSSDGRRLIGRIISVGVIICAAAAGLLVVRQVNEYPRTDDAEVFANYIGMAPLVNGPVTHLYVADNQLVKQGDPLFDIDQRPYAYALARAKSDQDSLQGEISDERRIIAAKSSGVDVAKASTLSAEASVAAPLPPLNRQKPMLRMRRRSLSAPMRSLPTPPTMFIASSRCSPGSLSP